MNRWLMPMMMGVGVGITLLMLLAQPYPQMQAQPGSETPTSAVQAPVISQSEAVNKAVEYVRQQGLSDEFGNIDARLLPFAEAVRAISGDLRYETALQEARAGLPGREPAKLVWLLWMPTLHSTRYVGVYVILDAMTGRAHEDWPNLPVNPPPPGLPIPTRPPLPTWTEAEQRALGVAAQATREARIRSGEYQILPTTGQETKGNVINVAGKQLRLPPDAYVESYIVAGICAYPPCPQLPAYVLHRGNERIGVDAAGEALGRRG